MKARIFDKGLKKNLLNYCWQSALAGICIGGTLYIYEVTIHGIIIAAIGSTAFVVFAMPNSVCAQPRRVIGGHLAASICGLIGWSIARMGGTVPALVAGCSLAVFLATFTMVATNTEHPPAGGTALGTALINWADIASLDIVLFVIGAAVVMSLVKALLEPWLRDLVGTREAEPL